MARSMGSGGSLALIPESWLKKAKNGILIPEWRKTPAEAKIRTSQMTESPWMPAALITIALLMKPLNRGTPEIEAAPTMQKIAVRGMVL